MPLPTIGNALHQIQTEVASPDNFGTGQRVTALGTEAVRAASREDQTLFWVDSAGAIAGGPQLGINAASTDVEVKHLGNSGEQVWIYVKNVSASTIDRGQTVTADAGATPYEVKDAGAGDFIVGVAQFDIPDDACAWVLKKGIGQALFVGASADLALVQAAAAAKVDDASATTSNCIGRTMETVSGAGLGLVLLFG